MNDLHRFALAVKDEHSTQPRADGLVVCGECRSPGIGAPCDARLLAEEVLALLDEGRTDQ